MDEDAAPESVASRPRSAWSRELVSRRRSSRRATSTNTSRSRDAESTASVTRSTRGRRASATSPCNASSTRKGATGPPCRHQISAPRHDSVTSRTSTSMPRPGSVPAITAQVPITAGSTAARIWSPSTASCSRRSRSGASSRTAACRATSTSGVAGASIQRASVARPASVRHVAISSNRLPRPNTSRSAAYRWWAGTKRSPASPLPGQSCRRRARPRS